MKRHISWKDIHLMVELLYKTIPKTYNSIYGIPRGGLILAVILSHLSSKPITFVPRKDTLIIDDICDKGITLSKFNNYVTATLHYKSNQIMKPTYFIEETKDWIVYPWETDESSKMDYLEEKKVLK